MTRLTEAQRPTSVDFDGIINALRRALENAQFAHNEAEQYGILHRAATDVADILGLFGPEVEAMTRERLRYASEQHRVAALILASEGEFRVGRKVPRNVYQGDKPAFMAATEDEAAEYVALMNAGRTALQQEESAP